MIGIKFLAGPVPYLFYRVLPLKEAFGKKPVNNLHDGKSVNRPTRYGKPVQVFRYIMCYPWYFVDIESDAPDNAGSACLLLHCFKNSDTSVNQAMIIGIMWLLMILLLNFWFGRIRGNSWAKLLHDYNIPGGKNMGIGNTLGINGDFDFYKFRR